jgi:hypothetical protein
MTYAALTAHRRRKRPLGRELVSRPA